EVPWDRALRRDAALFTGALAFSPRYASPEVFAGKASLSSDQYSLALTFCELVADTIPFRGRKSSPTERLAGKMDLGSLPEVLRPAVGKALSPQPGDRFPSCLDF